MITLICDLNISLRGHNAGYAQYVVDNIKIKTDDQVYFLFNKNAESIIDTSGSAVVPQNFYFTESDFQPKSTSDKFKFREWKAIDQYAKKLKIDKLFMLDLTHYEVQIGKNKVPYKISGIEFRPSHRIKAANTKTSVKLAAMIQKSKRRFFESILLRSKSLENIFILNDPKGVETLNKTYRASVFKYLADPIFDYPELDNMVKAAMPRIKKNKVTFIIFGSLDWRKNFNNIFEAFSLVDHSIHRDIALLIVGKIPQYFEVQFNSLVRNFSIINANIQLLIVDDFVSDSQMEYYFSIADVSLAIYAKFYGSSALLGRAAKYNVTSLVPNVGLMSELCENYKLGYLCDPNSPKDIKDKILSVYDDIMSNKRIDGSEFYKNHSPQRFLELLDFYS